MSSPVPRADVKALLTAANLGVPISWENEDFDRPEPPDTWILVEMTSNVLAPAELKDGVWVESGSAYIYILVPTGSGTAVASALAKDVANVFRGLGPRDVVYRETAIGGGRLGDDTGAWWTLTVVADWIYQDVIT